MVSWVYLVASKCPFVKLLQGDKDIKQLLLRKEIKSIKKRYFIKTSLPLCCHKALCYNLTECFVTT